MSLSGSVICITGKLSMVRKEFEEVLRKNRAKMNSAVTKTCTHVICSDSESSSSKIVKAKKLGITIISEGDILAILGPASSATAAPTSANNNGSGQTNTIVDGQVVRVLNRDYTMKNAGGVYTCTCPAWKFQSNKIDTRTCKHLKEYLGEEFEMSRVGATPDSNSRNKRAGDSSEATGTSNKKQKVDNGLFRPSDLMLAHSWNPEKFTPSDYLWSEKLDGMRALWDGKQLLSRQGNIIHAPAYFLRGFPANMALDGELFCGRGNFQTTVSIARRINGGEQWRQLTFVVFDVPSEQGGFEDRLAPAFGIDAEFIQVHPHEPCRDQQHLEAELLRVEAAGGEGLMMRRKGSPYKCGRSTELLKVKTFKDDEAIIYGHHAGKGRHLGRMGALMCKLKSGVEFKVGSGFSDAERENPPRVGTVITFRYFEMTNSGTPRFPTYLRIRPDLNASLFPSIK